MAQLISITGITKDHVANTSTYLIGANRIEELQATGTDSILIYRETTNRKVRWVVDETYASLVTLRDNHDAGKAIPLTVVKKGGQILSSTTMDLSIDNFIYVWADPADSNYSFILIEDETVMGGKVMYRVAHTRAAILALANAADSFSMDSLTLTPATNIDALNIVGTNMTTASAIDIDMVGMVSGQLIDITLSTSSITADSDIIRIVDSRNHDNLATDAYRGVTVEMSGNFGGAFASTTYLLNAEYSGTVNNSAVLYAVRGDLSAATLSGGTYAAGYFSDGTRRITLCDGTAAITAVGNSILPIIDMTPATNVDAIDITGTNMTTASILDANMSALISGNLIDIAIDTSDIAANSRILSITDSRDHDDGGADTYSGIYIAQSGAFPGTSASVTNLIEAVYSGTIGASGANADITGVKIDFSGATHTNGDVYGAYIDVTAALVAGTQTGLYIYTGATSDGIIIDAVTDAHTATNPLLDINLLVQTASCIGSQVDITHDTGLTGGTELVYAYNSTLKGLAANANGAAVVGYGATLSAVTGERADYTGLAIDVASVRDNADTDAGLTVGFTGTLNHSGATWYGTRVQAANGSTTQTDGTWYGHHILYTAFDGVIPYGIEMLLDATDANNMSYGIDISVDLANTGISSVENSATGIYLASTNTNADSTAAATMTVSSSLFNVMQANTSSYATADVLGGTLAFINYRAITDTSGTATSTTTALGIDYDLTETAGTLTVGATNVSYIDYDTVGTVTYGNVAVNLLNINGTDANTVVYNAGGTTISGALIDISGLTDGANGVLYGLHVTGNALTTATGGAAYITDGTRTVTVANGTNAIHSIGNYRIDGTGVTATHLFDLENIALTTGSLWDIGAITTKTSGYLYNGSLTTSVLDGSTLLDDFSVSCAHDGLTADTLRMIRRSWSGALPQGSANANLKLAEFNYSGTIGSGGAEGGTLSLLLANMDGTVNGSGIFYYGLEIDGTGVTNTSSADFSAIKANGTFDSIISIEGASVYFADFDNCTGANGTITSDSGTAATTWKARIKVKTDDGTDGWINVYSTSNEA